MCILVHKHCRGFGEEAPTAVVWIPVTESMDRNIQVDLTHASTQTVIFLGLESPGPNQNMPHNRRGHPRHVPAFEYLEDGRRFAVCRLLFYCDGFTQYAARNGSAGGCYMLPLNLPYQYRTSKEAVRVISLTPPGVSSNEAMREIIPDLVQGCISGFECSDEEGKFTLFLDVVGYVSDFPEATDKTDVLGHNANCPCHLCSFRKFSGPSSEGSSYAMQLDAHSNESSFARFSARTVAIRKAAYSTSELNLIGLKPTTGTCSDMSSLFAFAHSLEEKRKQTPPPLTSDGVPVVDALFDPYRSCFISPDHLLSGLAINILSATFFLLPDDDCLSYADQSIWGELKANGLILQRKVYSVKNRSLHSMSLSGGFMCSSFRACIFF